MQDLDNTSAVSTAALNINITETVYEMTLLRVKINKVRESFGGFIEFHKLALEVNVEIKTKCS